MEVDSHHNHMGSEVVGLVDQVVAFVQLAVDSLDILVPAGIVLVAALVGMSVGGIHVEGTARGRLVDRHMAGRVPAVGDMIEILVTGSRLELDWMYLVAVVEVVAVAEMEELVAVVVVVYSWIG